MTTTPKRPAPGERCPTCGQKIRTYTKSEKSAAASRENGKKGGYPRRKLTWADGETLNGNESREAADEFYQANKDC